LIIDSDAGTARVVGNGTVTIRLRSESHCLRTGETIDIAVLQNPWQHLGSNSSPQPTSPPATSTDVSPVHKADATEGTFEGALTRLNQAFSEAIASRHADSALRACLDLEQAIEDWSSDTLDGDIGDRARASLRSMISQLGDASSAGLQDPREVVGPYVEAMLAVRATVRAEKRFDLSDVIRDAFANLGIEVRDTPNGVEWVLEEKK
jgi:cysteinyl-tRNA synthetase